MKKNIIGFLWKLNEIETFEWKKSQSDIHMLFGTTSAKLFILFFFPPIKCNILQ